MSRMYRKTILVIEHDGLAVRAFTIAFALRSPDFDWKAAVKAACEEYVQSEEGRKVYQYNCGCFNWADFVQHVPKELCIKHGRNSRLGRRAGFLPGVSPWKKPLRP